MVKGLTCGVWDYCHEGHINLIKRAKELCDYLVVAVQTDEEVKKTKKKYPNHNLEERIRMVKDLGIADEVIPYVSGTDGEILRQVKPKLYIHGNDWNTTDRTLVYKVAKQLNIDIYLLPKTEGISSTQIANQNK